MRGREHDERLDQHRATTQTTSVCERDDLHVLVGGCDTDGSYDCPFISPR
jgi:hypothetical protein